MTEEVFSSSGESRKPSQRIFVLVLWVRVIKSDQGHSRVGELKKGGVQEVSAKAMVLATGFYVKNPGITDMADMRGSSDCSDGHQTTQYYVNHCQQDMKM